MTMFEAGATTWLLVLVSAAVLASGPSHLAHITGSARKIRMYMKNAYLQLKVDGTVTGAPDDQSSTTLLQRSSVNLGQVKIQGVTTCMYLCMDFCGIPYASREFTDECVFNEMIEEHHYNTYSSAKYSNNRRTLYLGMNKKGESRRVQVRAGTALGKLSTYTRVLTQTAEPEESMRHGRTVCLPTKGMRKTRSRCRMRMRRPRRRKKRPESVEEKRLGKRRCEECDDRLKKMMIGRKRKSRLDPQHRVRHRKHRTAVRLKEDEEDEEEEEEEDVTMTTDDDLLLFEDHTELFLDRNENE